YGLVDNWIRHIKDTYRLHKNELDAIANDDERFDRFVELNVQEQLSDLAKTSIVQQAWENGQELHLHAWVYGVGSGVVKDLNFNVSSNSELDEVYQLNF